MAKATHNGPSYTDDEIAGMTDYAPVPIKREEIGPSQPQDGKGSQARSESAETSEQEPSADPHSPARMTESHLPPDETVPSDANSTDGNTQGTKAQPSGKKAVPTKAAKKAATRSTVEDDF